MYIESTIKYGAYCNCPDFRWIGDNLHYILVYKVEADIIIHHSIIDVKIE